MINNKNDFAYFAKETMSCKTTLCIVRRLSKYFPLNLFSFTVLLIQNKMPQVHQITTTTTTTTVLLPLYNRQVSVPD